MPIRSFEGISPTLGQRVYIDEAVTLVGDVVLGDDVSIWPYCAIRGDVRHIRIGARTNVQDNTVLHVTHDGPYTPGGMPLLIGEDVTIGHAAIVHACTIEDACLIGMGSVILDGARVCKNAMVAAGAVVTPGKVVESGTLWAGNPARMLRRLSEREIEQLYYSAQNYVRLKNRYLAEAGSG
ncbi:MAG: gamma carbonic anhydrase family protein [Xanthomonadales bacterium]|nr:gamma carbonic anhydrase family protein [Xanthomonadales bacterium]